jgi:hypothetical protein
MDPGNSEVMPWSGPGEEVAAAPARGRFALVRRLFDWIVVLVFLLLLIASPLPMGANRDWAWSPMVLLVGALAIVCALGLGARDGLKISAAERTPLLVLIACFAILIAVSLLQMSTFVVPSISAGLYAKAREILGHGHAAVPTLAIDASRDVLLKCLACGLIFAIARTVCADRRHARLLLVALLASALLVVAYALLKQSTTHSCYVGDYLKKQGEFEMSTDRCLMSGTFVGSNVFACFVGMALAATIALFFGDRSRRGWDEEEGDHGSLLRSLTGTRLVLIASALAFTGCLLISGSRAGFASTVLGVLVLLFLMMRGRWRSRAQIGRTMLVGVAIAAVVGLIAGGALVHKMSTLSHSDSANRLVIWRAAVVAIGQSPWLGWGLGSFNDIYAILQPLEIPQTNDKAHSTPLETIVELGIPAAIPALMTVLLPWLVCLRGALQRRRQRWLPAAAFAISGIAIVHSTVDFSLQIPAVAFWVSAFLGLGWAHAFGASNVRPALYG